MHVILHDGLPAICREIAAKTRPLAVERSIELFVGKQISEFCYNDWVKAGMYSAIDRKFIEKYRDKMDFYELCIDITRPEILVKHFRNFVDWYCLSENPNITWDIIELNQDKINWLGLTKSCRPSTDNLRKIAGEPWLDISANVRLTPDEIVEFADRICWGQLLQQKNIKLPINAAKLYDGPIKLPVTSPDVFRYFADRIPFEKITDEAIIPANVLEKYHTRIPCGTLYRLDLPAEFIENHKDSLNFSRLLRHQKREKIIIPKYSRQISWRYTEFTEEELRKFADTPGCFVNWEAVTDNHDLSLEFMNDYGDRIFG